VLFPENFRNSSAGSVFGGNLVLRAENVEFLLRNTIVFDFVCISQPKKALFGVSFRPEISGPDGWVRFACEIVCRIPYV
jgi:hypothetical protein